MYSVTKVAFVAVGALAAVAGAQEVDPSDITTFPNCAQWCVNNMQQANKTEELGCSAGDNGCLCRNANFAYGVRDCSAQLCGDSSTGQDALQYAFDWCNKAGVQLSSVVSSGSANATGTGGSGGAGGVGGAVPVSTAQFTSTITTDGSTITTSGASTVFSTASGSVNPSATASQILSTITSDGSTFVSTLAASASGAVSTIVSDGSTFVSSMTGAFGSATSSLGDAASSAVSGTNSPQGTSTAQGFAAQMTAAPAGILAVAGVAAFLL